METDWKENMRDGIAEPEPLQGTSSFWGLKLSVDRNHN